MIRVIFPIILIFTIQINAQLRVTSEMISGNHYKIDINIAPDNYSIVDDGNKKTIRFEKAIMDESKPGSFILPKKDLFIAIPYNSEPEINLTVIKSKNFPAVPELNPEVHLTKNSSLQYTEAKEFVHSPNNNFYSIRGFLWIGNNYCVHISLNNFWFDDNRRIVNQIDDIRIEISLKNNIPLAFQKVSNKVDNNIINKEFASKIQQKAVYKITDTDSWIDYSKTYLKIGTIKDAIYRLTYTDLQQADIDINGIDPRSFKLINKGKEVPIFVEGENDGIFDNNDYIEFVGIRNLGGKHREVNTFNDPYNEYLGRYTDTTVYWLTWGGTTGSRVSIADAKSQAVSADTLKYYNDIIHMERDNYYDFSMQNQVRRELPFWVGNKTWIDGRLDVGTKNVNFSLSDVFPGKPVKIFTKLMDYASNISENAHLISLKLNSDPAEYDRGYINKYQQKVLSGESNSNFLINGTNTLKVNSYATTASLNSCYIDWYEIEYPRYLKTKNDSINFSFSYLNSDQLKTIIVSNINSKTFSFWKYGTRFRKFNSTLTWDKITIIDSVNSSDKFVLNSSTQITKPIIFYKKNFANLRNSQNIADYLIVTHKKFIAKANEYRQFISSAYNVNTKLIDIDDIYDEFAYGYFDPESIKEFLKSTHSYWQQPSPEYVLLIGAATYDYHGNKTKYLKEPRVFNYVPSFGTPVSDNWFVTWDSTGAYIPQMNIGRLPVNTVDELNNYFIKHSNYVHQSYDDWNKRYLFFSGGNSDNQSEIDQMRTVNNFIIDNYIVPVPVGGNYKHFYKTINPKSNFGPYTQQEFQESIDNGGVFISYIGHSGTQTWDNSITDPGQLKNKRGRSPLITDFGCSTVKFAEPDVVSFSQLFVISNKGQAISYIGNSSLGFTSTSTVVPQLFYRKILRDSVYQISEALKQAKTELISSYGTSEVNQLFTLTNTLIGDPIIKLTIPSKPDLSIANSDIAFLPAIPNDNMDSMAVKVKFYNQGKITNDTFRIKIVDTFSDSINYTLFINKKSIPHYEDELQFKIPVRNKAGVHKFEITLDDQNRLNEISKINNSVILDYNVVSSSLRFSFLYNYQNAANGPLVILNPSLKPSKETINFQISPAEDFNKFEDILIPFDSFFTKISLTSLEKNKRYWIRSRIKDENNFGSTNSFYYADQIGYCLTDKPAFNTTSLNNLKYSGNSVKLDTSRISFSAISAGYNDGSTAVISKNDQGLLPSVGRGHNICLFNSKTLEFEGYWRFDIRGGDASVTNNYINFLDTLSDKHIIIIAISNDAHVTNTTLKSKIKSIGSKYIDSLIYLGSWAIIGRKGALPGTVPEAYSKPHGGRVQIDTTIYVPNKKGLLATTLIGPAAEWRTIEIKKETPLNSKIILQPIGIKNSGEVDTLQVLSETKSVFDLSYLNSQKYLYLKFLAEFQSADNGSSPELSSLNVSYSGEPELGTNYQVVSVSKDSLVQGDSLKLKFFVYNVGESPADSFNVKIELVKPDNTTKVLTNSLVSKIDSMQRKEFAMTYKTNYNDGSGNMKFKISIDPDNKIHELFKDNNTFEVPFYVKRDTTPTSVTSASVDVKFDGVNIVDGDYVSSNPEINFTFSYPVWFPVYDSTAIKFLLDNKQVSYSEFDIYSDTINRKAIFKYKPGLKNGEHILEIYGENITGELDNKSGYKVAFNVSDELKLMNVFNYPNPFKGNTNFTFTLTQIPDDLKIKIYTVAGRLIKEINSSSYPLHAGYNSIPWDGKDEDGDAIANGTYIYKMIIKKEGKTQNSVQKLTVIR